jgi:hypothetical protein
MREGAKETLKSLKRPMTNRDPLIVRAEVKGSGYFRSIGCQLMLAAYDSSVFRSVQVARARFAQIFVCGRDLPRF